jgi:hypothetical protein
MDEMLLEHKRAKAPEAEPGDTENVSRPTGPAPSRDAPLVEREDWASFFVPWFMSATGGEWPEPIESKEDSEGRGPIGRRWRYEYFHCIGDPQAFEQYAEREIAAFNVKE